MAAVGVARLVRLLLWLADARRFIGRLCLRLRGLRLIWLRLGRLRLPALRLALGPSALVSSAVTALALAAMALLSATMAAFILRRLAFARSSRYGLAHPWDRLAGQPFDRGDCLAVDRRNQRDGGAA